MKFTDLKEEALCLWNSGEYESHMKLAEFLYEKYDLVGNVDYSRRTLSNWINSDSVDKEIVAENVKLAKQKQKQQDVNRIERKSFREYARVENAVSAIGESLLSINKQFASELTSKLNISPLPCSDGLDGVGVMPVTDVHFNELIDLPHNKYNFKIASRRLKKQTDESIKYFRFKGVKKVVFACTGDLLNSDRRLDEILNAETNRAKAATLAAHIIRQQILHIRNEGFEVDVVSVLGNESRVDKEMSFSSEAFSDNYDFTILAQVRDVIENMGIDGITFLSIDQMETVLHIGEFNVLFSHGINSINAKQKDIQSIIGKYSNQGVRIDYMIIGHGHSTIATDNHCQNSSVCGANTYSDHALGLSGRAAATCHTFIGKDHSFQYIDLQNADNDGYEIISQLEAYNVKSHSKIRQVVTTFQVVI